MIIKSMSRNGAILAIFALATTGAVTLTQIATKDKIKQQEQATLMRSLTEVMPSHAYDNQLTANCIEINDAFLGHSKTTNAYRTQKEDKMTGIILETTAPDGYSGKIEILSAIYVDGTVAGVRVIKHKETPGLGDKVELARSSWILSFNNKKPLSEKDPTWAVKKDGGQFDQFTGATITPRAVVNAVKRASLYVQHNQDSLFVSGGACHE